MEGARREGQIEDSQEGMMDGARFWSGGDGENIESTVIAGGWEIVKQRHSSAHHAGSRKCQGLGREVCGYPC